MSKMNQRSDSLKENLQVIGRKSLIRLQSWLLSHTVLALRGQKPESDESFDRSHRAFARSRSVHLRSIQASARISGGCSIGTSCANKRSPSGSIQSPSTGRKEKMPPTIKSSASGIRTSRDDGRRSQLTKRAGPAGSLPSNQAKCRSSSI